MTSAMTSTNKSAMSMTRQEQGDGKRMTRLMKQPLKPLVAVVVLLLGSQSANAAWDMYPSFSAEVGMDDNVRLDSQGEESATTGAVEGRLTVRNVSETHSVQAIAALRQTEYSGTDLKGGTTGLATVNANKRTERINYGFVATYQNQPLLRYGVIDTQTGQVIGNVESYIVNAGVLTEANPDLDIGFVEEQIRREAIYLSPTTGYQISTRGNVQLSARYNESSYDSTGDGLGLEDSEGFGASLQYQHELSERTTLLSTFGTDYFRPDQSPDSDRYDLTVGVSRKLTDRTQFLVEVGLGRSDTETGSKDTVVVYRASLDHRLERGQLSLYASRDNYPSGYGNVVETNQLSAQLRYSLTERWEAEVRGQFTSTNSNLDATRSFNDADYMNIESRVSYALTPNWKVGGAYRFSWTDRQIDPDTAQGNAVFAFVSYTPQRPF